MTANKISLLIADIDGSLVTPEKKVTDKAYQAIHQLREAGIKLSLTSGRPPRGMKMFIRDLEITLPLSGFNGGIIFHPDLSIIKYYCPTQDIIQPIFEMLTKYHLDIWGYTERDWYVSSKYKGPHLEREIHAVEFLPIIIDDVSKLTAQTLIKITGVSDDLDAVSQCAEDMRQAFLGQVMAVASEPYYLDITHPDANKGAVVSVLSERLGIPTCEIATIGDMPNDIYMFKESGLSIAMGNANDEVKKQADFVTTSNSEEGFANAVERFILSYSHSR